MSQLLCEQVVGRGLRRTNYDIGSDGKLDEQVAKVFGVPFEVIPFKENSGRPPPPKPKRHHVRAVPEKARFAISFPRVEGYQQVVRRKVSVDWESIAPIKLDAARIPTEVDVKHLMPAASGRRTLSGPGKLEQLTLAAFRAGRREQELVFHLSRDLTRLFQSNRKDAAPNHILFPQILRIVQCYVAEKIEPGPATERIDAFLSPYYGWVIERLAEAIKPDATAGEDAELPVLERTRSAIGSTTDVSFWTSRDVREVLHSHVNLVVADTLQWEQSAAFIIDNHRVTSGFIKNAGLGFAIPYLFNGQLHDYEPDFLIRLQEPNNFLILETKGYDERADFKVQAAQRWVSAVNASNSYGQWQYRIARSIGEVRTILDSF
jgi:type III restriction enzyme